MVIFLIILLCLFNIISCSDGVIEGDSYVFKGNPPVMFSEVYVANVDYKDEFGEKPGWVEFYNPAETTVNLKGYSLTNYANEILWTFGDVEVEPHGYLVVFMSGRNKPDLIRSNDSVDLFRKVNNTRNWANPSDKNIATHIFSKSPGIHGTIALVDISVNAPDAAVIMELNAIPRTHQILLRGYLDKNSKLDIRFAQKGTLEWLGWLTTIEGSGIENDLYVIKLPPIFEFSDLQKISFRPMLINDTVNFFFSSIIAMQKNIPVLHASFELNKSGGKLFLMDSQRQVRDSVAYLAETKDLSFAKNFESGKWVLSKPPTPNAANSNETYKSQMQSFTAANIPESGYFQNGLSFTLPSETNGTIRCDTTGASPNENSPLKSGSELNLTKTTVLRCAQFKNGAYLSESILRTYIIGERLPSLPVVSIAVDPKDMFDPIAGLYTVNYREDTELPIQIDFFEGGARHTWSYPAGIKIRGGTGSRGFPKKSVNISFKAKYGQKTLNYPLFPEYQHLTKFNRFILRNNGNNFGKDYIRDMLMTSLTEGLGIDYQKGRSVIVYYNGEYFGIHNLRERANKDYFKTNYGIDENYIDLVKGNNEVSSGSDADYQDILKWVGSVTLNDENLKQLESRIDLDNYTNYMQSEIYFINRDWPGNNLKRWRSNLVSSKWRWLLYDTDFGFSTGNIPKMLDFITEPNGPTYPNPPSSTLLIRKLLENQNYKNAFINRFSLLLATYYAPARVEARINALMKPIESEIPLDQQRWNLNASAMNIELTRIRDFGKNRPTQMQEEIEDFFGLSNPVDFTLSIKGNGKILVHNLPVLNGNATFKAYPSVPIIIKAVPNSGARFKGWSDGNMQAERTVTVSQVWRLEAEF